MTFQKSSKTQHQFGNSELLILMNETLGFSVFPVEGTMVELLRFYHASHSNKSSFKYTLFQLYILPSTSEEGMRETHP